jgi:predicted MFS family arabinose efflux permease
MSMSPRIAERFGFSTSLWLGAVIMMSGLILFLIYALIDARDEQRRGAVDAASLSADKEFHLRDVVWLLRNTSFRLIVVLCAAFYAVIFPFQDYLADLLKHAYGYSEVAAGDLTSLIPWGAVVFTVIFGAFVDKKGKRATLMVGGALLLVASSLGFALTVPMPGLLVPLFGVAFAMVPAAMWPAVALIAGVRRLGTAYGLMYWLQNLCWWSMTLLAGWVLDTTNPAVTAETLKLGTGAYDYTATMLLFAAIGVIAVAFAVGLKLVDRGPDSHGLELPSAEAAEVNEAKRSAA